jgi:hypothetical protein
MLLTDMPILDDVLHAHARELGGDFAAYRNHTYRVANLCIALTSRDDETLRKIAVATAFHDIGIWTAGTFDYLQPSLKLANAYVARSGQSPWMPEIEAMILQHHKVLPYRVHPDWLVEPFRKADLIDVSRGLITFGLPRALLAELFAQWPSAGFHKRLVQLALRRARTHPWSPLPMIRL